MSTATPSTIENLARQGEKRKRDEPQQQVPQQDQGFNHNATRERIVEILSNTANGCLSELGYYPGMWMKLKELEKQNTKWQEENVKLFQDNQRLVNILKHNQVAMSNISLGDSERINHITNLELENQRLKEEKAQMGLLHVELSKKYDGLVQSYSLAYNQVHHLTSEIHALKMQNQQNGSAQRMSPGMSMVPSGQVRQDNQGRNASSISPSHTPSIPGQGHPSMPIRSNVRASVSNPPSRRSSLNIVSPPTLSNSYNQQISPPPVVAGPPQYIAVNSGPPPQNFHPQQNSHFVHQNAPPNQEQHFVNGFPQHQNLTRRVSHPGAYHPYAGHPVSMNTGPPVQTMLQSKPVSRPTSRTNSMPLPTVNTSMNQPPPANAQPAPMSASAILASRPPLYASPSPLGSPRNTEGYGLPSPAQLERANPPGTIAPNDTYIQAPPPIQPQPTLIAPQPSKPIFSLQHPVFYPTDQLANTQPLVSPPQVAIPTSVPANQPSQNQQQLASQPNVMQTGQGLLERLQALAPPLAISSDSPMRGQTNTPDNVQPKIELDLNAPAMDNQVPPVDVKENDDNNGDDDDDDEMFELGPDGLLLPKDCFPAIFEDVGDGKLICKLCVHRHQQGIQEQPTEPFVNCTDEQLEKHCVGEHNEAWEMLRKGVDE